METTNTTFPNFLKEELLRRKSKNVGYSLRAFSKNLGLSSSFVSKVISGKKNLSPKTLLTVAARLKIDQEQIENFLIQLPEYKMGSPEFKNVAADEFSFISDWHHFAILEAVTLEEAVSTPEWFSEKLGISVDRSAKALQRLERLGMLKRNSDGNLINGVKNHSTLSTGLRTTAHTEHERQLLLKAIEALDEVSQDERSQSSITMAIPISRLPEAKEKIKTFQREMMTLLQRKGKRDSVYQLATAFYPLTQNKTNKQRKKK